MLNKNNENVSVDNKQHHDPKSLMVDIDQVPWPIWMPVVVFILALFVALIPASFPLDINILSLTYISLALQDGVLLLAPILIVVKYYKLSITALGFRKTNIGKIIGIGILAGAGCYLLNVVFAVLVEVLFPGSLDDPQGAMNLFSYIETDLQMVFLITLLCVIIPFIEEVYFRGFVYPPLKKRFGLIPALLISGAIFALAHSSIWTFLPLLVGGIGFAWVYDRYKNIWINFVAHMFWNTTVTVIYFIAQ